MGAGNDFRASFRVRRTAFPHHFARRLSCGEIRRSMSWLIVGLICAALGAVAFLVWRKWIAPWRQVEVVITQIGRGERPRTFLMEGSVPAQRIGFQLEKIVNELEQLQKQIAKRESGMQTIFSAMHDALLVVDSNRQVILTNQTF